MHAILRGLALLMVSLLVYGCLESRYLPATDAGGLEDPGGRSRDGGGNGACLETLPGCETGEGVCAGQYVRTCSADGTAYLYEYCFPQTCKNGVCVQAACSDPGRAHCVDILSGIKCKEDLSMQTTFDCADGTVCAGGDCFPVPCTPGDVRCAAQGGFVTCTMESGAWAFSACPAGEFCDVAVIERCVPKHPQCVLEPLSAFCEDLATAMHCSPEGKAVATQCGAEDVCVDGFCQAKACGVTYEAPDDGDTAGSGDAGEFVDAGDTVVDVIVFPPDTLQPETLQPETLQPDIPPLEPPALAGVQLHGGDFTYEDVTFSSSKIASYIHVDKTLQVTMAKGSFILEVQIQNIEEGVVGNFSSADPSSVAVLVLFNNGSELPEGTQWRYVSVVYEVTLEEFGPANEGRVEGTFSGALQDVLGGGPCS